MTQDQIKSLFIPIIKEKGKIYKKVKRIYAEIADGGEKIETITSDGTETKNTAKKGDYIITNQTQSQEQYIVKAASFRKRYVLLKQHSKKCSEYQAIGKIIAVRLNKRLIDKFELEQEFHFIAKWGEKMIAKKGDVIVCPLDYSEIYRIARKEFFETYQLEA